MKNVLTQKEFQQFMVDGYFIFRNLVSKEDVEQMHQCLIDIMAKAGEGTGKVRIDARRGDGQSLTKESGIRKMAHFVHNERIFWDKLCMNENVQALNRIFLGEDTSLWFDSAFTKPPKVGEPTPWHQDIGLWAGGFPIVKREPELVYDALSIWMGITRCDIENGCLQVVPGTHHTPIIEHVKHPGIVHEELPRHLLEDKKPVHIELNPGDALVWNSLVWHYSPRNESDKKRWGVALVSLRTEAAEKIFAASEKTKSQKIRHLVEGGKAVPFEKVCTEEKMQTSAVGTY
jgi:phytanoyl-CoA hydroxylase